MLDFEEPKSSASPQGAELAPSGWRRLARIDLGPPLGAWLRGNLLLLVAVALSLLFCLGFIRSLPRINGPDEWYWHYQHGMDCAPPLLRSVGRLLPGLVVAALLGWGVWMGLRGRRWARFKNLAGLLVLLGWGLFYQWTTLDLTTWLGSTNLGWVIQDPAVCSYYTAARQIAEGQLPPLPQALGQYPALLPHLPLHASTHPPGVVLLGYGTLRLLERHEPLRVGAAALLRRTGVRLDQVDRDHPVAALAAFTLGFMMLLGGLVAAWPLFALIRMEGGGDRVAWAAALLWTHYPALALFTPESDQLFPLLALLCLYCAARGLRGRPVAWGVALGAILMLAIACSFTLLFLIPMLGLLAWLHLARESGRSGWSGLWRPARPGRALWLLVGASVAICLALDALLRGCWGLNLFAIFRAALNHQFGSLLEPLHRTYAVWLFYNIYDFLLFAGPALAVLALAGLAGGLLHRTAVPWSPALAVFLLAVLLLDVSGLTPAETSRIWLFLAPGLAWAASAELIRRSPGRWLWPNLVVLLLAQHVFTYVSQARLVFPAF